LWDVHYFSRNYIEWKAVNVSAQIDNIHIRVNIVYGVILYQQLSENESSWVQIHTHSASQTICLPVVCLNSVVKKTVMWKECMYELEVRPFCVNLYWGIWNAHSFLVLVCYKGCCNSYCLTFCAHTKTHPVRSYKMWVLLHCKRKLVVAINVTCSSLHHSSRCDFGFSSFITCLTFLVVSDKMSCASFLSCGLNELPYLCVCKPHFFDKNLPSKIGMWLVHRISCPFDDWARDAGIVCCKIPSRDRQCLRLILQAITHAWMCQRIISVSAYFDYLRVADTIDSQKSEDRDMTDKLP
jgi:hypothetical protein